MQGIFQCIGKDRCDIGIRIRQIFRKLNGIMLLKRHYAIFLYLMRSRDSRKQGGGRGMHNAADGS